MGGVISLTDRQIPILGQPFKTLAHVATVMIECQCEDKTPLLLVGVEGTRGPCPSCGRIYGFGKISIQIGEVRELPKDDDGR